MKALATEIRFKIIFLYKMNSLSATCLFLLGAVFCNPLWKYVEENDYQLIEADPRVSCY